MANQGNVSPRRRHVSGEHFELFSRPTQPCRQPGRAQSLPPKIATESLTAPCSFLSVGPAESQPIYKRWPDLTNVERVQNEVVRLLVEVSKTEPRGPLRLLPRGTTAHHGAAFGAAHRLHLAATSASAEEQIAAIGLEPRNAHAGRHVERLQNLSRSRIDSPQIALVTFPGAVPQLSVDPGDPGDEAIGLNRAKNRPCLGIDLIDLPVPVLPHPECPFGPREPRVTAAAGRRDRGQHSAGLRVDLLDATRGDLE